MKIEELYPTEGPLSSKPMMVSIRANPVTTRNITSTSAKGVKSPEEQHAAGKKLVRKQTASSMKLEQLNKHEEMSYIEDAEANEAILKNTISKDELCRFLTPLKFMEIETWRKEVPFGNNIDESEVEHRKWRTPVEILLPTSAQNDDGTISSLEGVNHSNDDVSGKKKATSSYNKRRKFYEEVRRQNAAVLQRSKSDAAKLQSSRPRLRDVCSAGEKPEHRSQEPPKQSGRKYSAAEGRLRTAYAPANGIPSAREIQALRGQKNPGHIYVNHSLANGAQAAMMSYFSPGKLVSPTAHGKAKSGLPRMNQAIAENQSSLQSATANGRSSQTSSSALPLSSGQRISSSSWPGMTSEGNQRRAEQMRVDGDVQVLPFDAARPRTAGEELLVANNRRDAYQRHSKLRGAQRSGPRGWRTWNNRRMIENSFGAATRLYQNAVLPKRTPPSRTLGKLRPNNIAHGASEESPKPQNMPLPSGRLRDPGDGEASPAPKTSPKGFSNHASNVSHGAGRAREIKVRAFQVSKDKDVITRVAACPPIDVKITTVDNAASEAGPKNGTTLDMTNGLNYIKTDGLIELTPLQNGAVSTPWVAETFSPALAANEGYYVRQQRQNKTVTFRLGAA